MALKELPIGLLPNDLVLSKSLCHGIKQWFLENTYFNSPIQLFKTFYDYPRIDIPQAEMSAVTIYLDGPNTVAKPGKVMGKVKIEFTFNLREQREEQAKQIYNTMETVRGQFLTNPAYLQQYLQDYTPGLMWIQSQNTHETIKYREALLNKEASLMVPMVLEYQISILRNQRALWERGVDYYSTSTRIYEENSGIEIEVNGQLVD